MLHAKLNLLREPYHIWLPQLKVPMQKKLIVETSCHITWEKIVSIRTEVSHFHSFLNRRRNFAYTSRHTLGIDKCRTNIQRDDCSRKIDRTTVRLSKKLKMSFSDTCQPRTFGPGILFKWTFYCFVIVCGSALTYNSVHTSIENNRSCFYSSNFNKITILEVGWWLVLLKEWRLRQPAPWCQTSCGSLSSRSL